MSEGALELIRRVTISDESAIYTNAANYTHLAGVEGLTYTHPREPLADNRHLLISKGQHASHLGAKSGEINFSVPVTSATAAECTAALEAAFGLKSAKELTFSSATTTTVTSDDGTDFDPIILTTISGVEVPVPIKSVSTNTATYAILPGGTTTAVATALDTGGACFIQDYTAAANTLHIEVDANGETDYVPYTYSGAVPTKCEINLDLSNRLMLNWTFTAGDFLENSAANVSNPSAISTQFLGYAAQCYLQDISTAAAGTQIDLNSLTVNLCWDWVPRTAVRANTSNQIPGSPIVGYKPNLWCPDGVTMTLTKNAASYYTARTNKTPFGFFMVFSVGGPGSTASTNSKMALWIPRLVLDEDPVETDIDGLTGVQLKFKVELDPNLTGNAITQGCLAFFV